MKYDPQTMPREKPLDGWGPMAIMKLERFGVPSSLTAVSDDTFGCTRSVAWTNHPACGTAFSRVGPIIGAVLDFFFAVTLEIGYKG